MYLNFKCQKRGKNFGAKIDTVLRFARVQFSPMEVLPDDQILIQFN